MPSQDDYGVSEELRVAVARCLACVPTSALPASALQVVRKSFDARRGRQAFDYVVDVDAAAVAAAGARRLLQRPGLLEA